MGCIGAHSLQYLQCNSGRCTLQKNELRLFVYAYVLPTDQKVGGESVPPENSYLLERKDLG